MAKRNRSSSPEVTTTHCPYCALNCGLELGHDGVTISQTIRWKGSPLTGGALCSKGVSAFEQVAHRDRIRMPLRRRGNDFEEIGWEEALDEAASGFLRIADRHGPAANAVLSGGSLTNEKVYLMGKLARVALRTPNVDYNGRFCMTSAGAANKLAFGADRMMTPLDELARAEVVVVVGANISAAFPVVLPKLLDGVRRRGGRVIVVDPRASRFVKPGDLHLANRPGTDSVLFNGLLGAIADKGLIDDKFVRNRTTGIAEALAAASLSDLDTVARTVDVDAALIDEAARVIGTADRCMYLHGRGPEQQVNGVDNVLSIINVGLACGHVGRPGCGINMLTGQRNGQGGREWGQRCNQLPAGRDIDDPADRATVAGHWGVDVDDLPPSGLTYVEILQAAARGDVRGLLTICTNMNVSAPDLDRVDEQMAALEHVVMIEPFFSRSARFADIVLPGTTFAEESGTITTLEGRVVRIDQAVPPLPRRSDLDIIRNLARRFGAAQHFDFHRPVEVFEEMRRVSAGGPVDYAGITYDRIRNEGGVFWPCPDEKHSGTPQLYVERFHHEDGKARFHAVRPTTPPVVVDDEYPLVLTTGRVLAQFLSGNQTMRIAAQQAVDPDPYVEVHPAAAQRAGLQPGSLVTLTSRQATVEVAWRPNPDLRPDTLFLPYHWPLCNRLVASDLDPVSKIPGFKYTPVALAANQSANAATTASSIGINRAVAGSMI
ncbi:MAG: molybdopterin oxidoreductase family protein [Ilumatobacter sp.]